MIPFLGTTFIAFGFYAMDIGFLAAGATMFFIGAFVLLYSALE